ncbi:unnamed protein product, partial [Meganyctiphanes norvegica]
MLFLYLFQDNLKCEICFEHYDDNNCRPKSLPCGHTFCNQCVAKGILKGQSTCPTCRKPHNAKSVNDLPMNVVLERIIRDRSKTSNTDNSSSTSEEKDEEDECNGGQCSKHKKGTLYFFCQTHGLQICRECTVLDHTAPKCKIVSLKEEIERQKQENIRQVTQHITAINDTVSSLGQFVKDKDKFILSQELQINKWKKSIEDTTTKIAEVMMACEKAQKELTQGKEKIKEIEDGKDDLQNPDSKETIAKQYSDVQTVSMNVVQWIQDINKEFNLPPKMRAQKKVTVKNEDEYRDWSRTHQTRGKKRRHRGSKFSSDQSLQMIVQQQQQWKSRQGGQHGQGTQQRQGAQQYRRQVLNPGDVQHLLQQQRNRIEECKQQ